MPEWFAVILLGIIEGITEFIPISSTGHLLIAQRFLGERSDLFTIVIQSGAVLAVLPLFRGRINQVIHHWREKPTQDLLAKIFVAFAITGAGGLLLDKFGFKLPETITPIALALIIGGILFIVVERRTGDATRTVEITWGIVIAVGVAQLVAAIFPGASRSGTTILIALMLGATRPAATEFSFLVGIPTMLAAGGLKIFRECTRGESNEDWSMVILGTVVSAIVSFVAVKWLLRYVQSHTFVGFGWYRIVFGALLLIWAFTLRGQ
ncbi:MAG: undecaprenyl-diphosphate phosphatase [Verrucomicrobia bacterium]|nr:undecaprenyl-diphosphate phosphatase [Verrucomicrobiota bacterium]